MSTILRLWRDEPMTFDNLGYYPFHTDVTQVRANHPSPSFINTQAKKTGRTKAAPVPTNT